MLIKLFSFEFSSEVKVKIIACFLVRLLSTVLTLICWTSITLRVLQLSCAIVKVFSFRSHCISRWLVLELIKINAKKKQKKKPLVQTESFIIILPRVSTSVSSPELYICFPRVFSLSPSLRVFKNKSYFSKIFTFSAK